MFYQIFKTHIQYNILVYVIVASVHIQAIHSGFFWLEKQEWKKCNRQHNPGKKGF